MLFPSSSIIGSEGNSLTHAQLPKKWREERGDTLIQFFQRFDREWIDVELSARGGKLVMHAMEPWDCEQVCESSNTFQMVQ